MTTSKQTLSANYTKASSPPIDNFLSRLEKVKSLGHGKWLACCPAHNDKNPSLSIKSHDGKVLIHCFAGCGAIDVLAAVGMDFSDLFPPTEKPYQDRYKLKKGLPRLSSYDLVKTLLHESGILGVAISDLLTGQKLSDVDIARVKQSCVIISNIRSEVGR